MTATYAPGRPSWVELGTTDPSAASRYYGDLFGWTTEDLGPEAGGYSLLRLHGKQVGGIGTSMDPERPPEWSVYLASADAEDTAERVIANGGRVVLSPMDVMDQGRMAIFTDPTGATFAVWEAGATAGAELVNETGSMAWAELMTSDVDRAKDFYHEVFPLDIRDIPMPDGTNYTLLETEGQSVAGAMPIPAEMSRMPSHWSAYFAVEDCNATADRAVSLGGSEVLREDSVAGRFAVLTDPQGASFSILQPDPDYRP